MIQLTNTLHSKKETFKPINDNQVQLYVCGVTPYDYAHIGHGRCYVTFDVLYRLLTFLGYSVKYCRNFTDIDDKLLKRAANELGDKMRYTEIADKFIVAFQEDMKRLNCLSPDVEPRVTEVIPQIIEFIQGLIDKGNAYEVDGDVYFSVRNFDDYGKLSKRNIDDLQSGARVEVNTRKKDPLDFALWKSEPEGDFWKSPWGWGRPGWHIECSVMASHFLSPHIDIHGGGMDLIFPHHENEVAQSEGLHGAPFSRMWVHNAFVRINKEKMSKSLGNFFTLKDVMNQWDPMIIRFYILNHNYNIPLDFTEQDIEAAATAYKRLCTLFADVDATALSDEDIKSSPVAHDMVSAVSDDLNVARAVGILFENMKRLRENDQERTAVKGFLQRVLGLTMATIGIATAITPEIQALIDERAAARAAKDWARADELRDQLVALGVELQDIRS